MAIFKKISVKIYFDAGLTDLGKASGYNPTSITSNFKRTHLFLMEAWESLYQFFMGVFLENSKEQCPPDFLQTAMDRVKNLSPSETQGSVLRNLKYLLEEMKEKYNFQKHFAEYMQQSCSANETICFWAEFVFQNSVLHIIIIALYFTVRNGQWSLRIPAIKEMAALFTAFDRHNYQKLIPMHI